MNKILKENNATDLFEGIFWIVNEDNMKANENYCFCYPVDSFGNVLNNSNLNSKNSNTFNHKRTWECLGSKWTKNKSFNYYPRGRVQISNNKAVIYANPRICTQEILEFVKSQFHLYSINGIEKVIMNADGSEHYKCHFDREE